MFSSLKCFGQGYSRPLLFVHIFIQLLMRIADFLGAVMNYDNYNRLFRFHFKGHIPHINLELYFE